MRVRVHDADLAAEEGAALGALETALEASVVREGPVEEARAVDRQQVAADQPQVPLRLLAREELREDRLDHREEAVADARLAIARVQPQLDATVLLEVAEVGQHAVADQQALELVADAREH